MSARELIQELDRKVVEIDPETKEEVETEIGVYDGLDDASRLEKLNEWHTVYILCPTEALAIRFEELNLIGRIQVALNKRQLDDRQQAQWFGLEALSRTKGQVVLFSTHPLEIPAFFTTLRGLDVIDDTELDRLNDLGIRQHTIARRVLNRDATADDLVKVVELEALHTKIEDRRGFVQQEIDRLQAELNTATEELQKQDPADGTLIGDKDYELPWEKA